MLALTNSPGMPYTVRALTCLFYAHPDSDVIYGIFAAQPDLCGELVDMFRPTVSGQRDRGTWTMGACWRSPTPPRCHTRCGRVRCCQDGPYSPHVWL